MVVRTEGNKTTGKDRKTVTIKDGNVASKTETGKTAAQSEVVKAPTQASARKFARKTFGDGCIVTKTREVVYRYRIMIPGNVAGEMTIVASAMGIEKAIEQAQEYATKNPKSVKGAK